MSLRRKITVAIILAVALTIIGFGVYFVCGITYTVRHIPEAYAAWDTGTLLVEYMKVHDDKWPASWDDLLSITNSNSGSQIVFRGRRTNDTNYANTLQTMVAINWTFDPKTDDKSLPVTRLDGTKFKIVWSGAEPNEMVHAYLKARKDIKKQ